MIVKNITKAVSGIIIILACCNFNQFKGNKLKEIEWHLGIWEMKNERGTTYERWYKLNKNEFAGESFIVNGMDTLVLENIRLIYKSLKLHYIPTVKGQNNEQAVQFIEKKLASNYFIFENLKHDFPQLISYTLINNDSLRAVISGKNNNKEISRVFFMKRVKSSN